MPPASDPLVSLAQILRHHRRPGPRCLDYRHPTRARVAATCRHWMDAGGPVPANDVAEWLDVRMPSSVTSVMCSSSRASNGFRARNAAGSAEGSGRTPCRSSRGVVPARPARADHWQQRTPSGTRRRPPGVAAHRRGFGTRGGAGRSRGRSSRARSRGSRPVCSTPGRAGRSRSGPRRSPRW